MSTDRPPESDPHRDSPTDEYTSNRDRSYPGDVARLNGHEFVAIDEWLPGTEPTPYEIDFTDGYEYRTRYWRCRKCSQECNHRDEFTTPCNNPQSPTALEAGGYSIDDPRTRRALNEKLDVRFATVGRSTRSRVRAETPTRLMSRQQRVPVLISSSASQTTAASIFAVSTSRSERDLSLHQMGRLVADCGMILSLETVCIPRKGCGGSKGVHRSNP